MWRPSAGVTIIRCAASLRRRPHPFGSLLWSNNAPPIFRGDDIPWDMQFDADKKSFAPYRKSKPGRKPAEGKLAELTDADEHAI